MCLVCWFIHVQCLGTMCSPMVRMRSSVLGIADNICTIHRIFSHDVFHLTFCPVCKFVIARFFFIDQCTELCSCIIPTRTIVIQHGKTSWCFCQKCRVGGICNKWRCFRVIWQVPQNIVRPARVSVRQARPIFQIPAENIPISRRIGNRGKFCKHTAPHGIPAVHPNILPAVSGVCNDSLQITRIGMSTHIARSIFINGNNVVDIVIFSGAFIEPDCCPCQFVIIIAGCIESAIIAQAGDSFSIFCF